LTVRFGGTSTLVLDDGHETIMIDGFFSRPSTLPMLFAPLRSNRVRVERDLKRLGVRLRAGSERTVRALFVAHSHHDHAMDSALVNQLTGAEVIGSRSTAIVVGAQGFKNTKVVGLDRVFPFERFTVTLFETPHASHDMPLLRGKVNKPAGRPPFMWDYKASDSHSYLVEHHHSGRCILIVPSATHLPEVNPFKGVVADLVLLSVAKVGFMRVADGQKYWRRTVTKTGAKRVVGIHWDDIRRPLGDKEGPIRSKTIPRLQDRFHRGMRILMPLALRDGVRLRLPMTYEPVNLGPPPLRHPENDVTAFRCKSRWRG
ncbi:MAG TPA: MBL fold metallo-hydrolase, partial [Allosphingosinicella sp.]|nr:MBL fold metallo-hydrolase [Allosphingosinicella sp.]